MMDVDEPSASTRAARSQGASNVLGMLICATTERQSKQEELHHGLFMDLQVFEQCLLRILSTCLLDPSLCYVLS